MSNIVSNEKFKPTLVIGASKVKLVLWYFVNAVFFKSSINPSSALKIILLKAFGAKIGEGVVIKPSVNIKYPWKLNVDDHTWIGEEVWIDNLVQVSIGKSVCISQGALLLTGNHNYKKTTFDLITGEILLEDGVWIGARATVCPGTVCRTHSIVTVGSVVSKELEPYGIYKGNPAIKISDRFIS